MCFFTSRRVDATRERDVPERYPNRIEFSEVSFGEVSVDVRLGRSLDCLARGRLGGEGERARRFVRVWSAMTTETTVKRVAGGAHAPSLDPAVARAFEAYDHAFTVCDATRPDCPIVYVRERWVHEADAVRSGGGDRT